MPFSLHHAKSASGRKLSMRVKVLLLLHRQVVQTAKEYWRILCLRFKRNPNNFNYINEDVLVTNDVSWTVYEMATAGVRGGIHILVTWSPSVHWVQAQLLHPNAAAKFVFNRHFRITRLCPEQDLKLFPNPCVSPCRGKFVHGKLRRPARVPGASRPSSRPNART